MPRMDEKKLHTPNNVPPHQNKNFWAPPPPPAKTSEIFNPLPQAGGGGMPCKNCLKPSAPLTRLFIMCSKEFRFPDY